ncbi:hypothetical protein HRbin36_02480 [bacterium HR36]|nr:hypothetical protein HRbin36_02480 [bacterium HR36]
MLETFTLRLVLGMLATLAVLPQEVPPRFFRIHLLIALGLITLAGVVAWSNEAALYWLGLGLAGASCFAGTWFWLGEAHRIGLVPVVLGTVSVAMALGATANASASLPWSVLEHGSAALQLGLALTAMLLGHYYLITPGMSPRPLVRLTVLLMAVIVLRAGIVFAKHWTVGHSLSAPGAFVEKWLWLSLRWLAGVLAAGVFAVLAWRCARVRSTQSATGILYAAVICTFLGELAQLLLDNSPYAPAGKTP